MNKCINCYHFGENELGNAYCPFFGVLFAGMPDNCSDYKPSEKSIILNEWKKEKKQKTLSNIKKLTEY